MGYEGFFHSIDEAKNFMQQHLANSLIVLEDVKYVSLSYAHHMANLRTRDALLRLSKHCVIYRYCKGEGIYSSWSFSPHILNWCWDVQLRYLYPVFWAQSLSYDLNIGGGGGSGYSEKNKKI